MGCISSSLASSGLIPTDEIHTQETINNITKHAVLKQSKGSMSQLIHALGMKLRESVSSKVVYKVILVAHFTQSFGLRTRLAIQGHLMS